MLRSKRLYFIQLIHIDSIGSLFTGNYVMNLLVIHGNIRLGNRRPIFDRQAIIINDGISRLDGTFFTKVNLLGQLNSKRTFFVNDAYVFTDRKFGRVCLPPFDGQGIIQFLGNNIPCIPLKFQSVIKGSYWVIFAIGIFIDNTGNAVLAVNTGFASSASDGQAIGSIFTLQTNRPILAVDDDRRAVFAVDADRTVNAILARFTFFTNRDAVALDVLVHLDGQAAIGIPDDLEVFSGIIRILFRAFPFNGQFLAQVTMNSDVCIVALEIQALCCHFLQLSHVNSVGIKRARSDIGNLARQEFRFRYLIAVFVIFLVFCRAAN